MKLKSLLIIVISLVCLIFFIPNESFADVLNDEQRKAFVSFVVDFVEQGNQKQLLRYTQGGERTCAYNWSTVSRSVRQRTPGKVFLKAADAKTLENMIKSATGKEIKISNYEYQCNFLGADIKGAIGMDCSSFCSAMYHLTSGTTFQYTSSGFNQNSAKLFNSSSDISSAEPGDVLWKSKHVAIYLGDYKGDGVKYIAHARGFQDNKKAVAPEMSKLLFEYLSKNLTAVKEHPAHKAVAINLQLPSNGVLDSRQQVIIAPLRSVSFSKVLKYNGEVKPGVKMDLSAMSAVADEPSPTVSRPDSNSSDGNNIINGETTNNSTHDILNLPGNSATFWPANLNLSDETLATSKGYFYKGTPTYGQYKGRVEAYDWLISKPIDVMDWIVGAIVTVLKIEFIGWTAILENVISSILNFGVTNENASSNGQAVKVIENNDISEEKDTTESVLLGIQATSRGEINREIVLAKTENTNSENSNTNSNSEVQKDSSLLESDAKKVITVEDVLFNRVPILDINFFDFNKAGGQQLEEGSLILTVRQSIATWYYTLRIAVVMGMLLVLLYVAIKMALSTVASEKAEYKSKLKDWLVGFIIVMAIHYFMVVVVNFNNYIVQILDPVATSKTTVEKPTVETGKTSTSNLNETEKSQVSLYEAIKVQAYDIKPATGFTATIMYMILVFLLIRFVILYSKRLFTLAILTVVSPIMGIMYAMNKKQAPLKDWIQEYAYNVLVQFFHVIIYTALVSVAIGLSATSLFRAGFLALILMGFLFKAEDIIKKIFGVSKSKSLSSLTDSSVGQLAVIGAGKKIMERSSKMVNNQVKNKNSLYNKGLNYINDKYNNWYKSQMQPYNWSKQFDAKDNETEEEKNERVGDKILRENSLKPNVVKMNGIEYLVDKPKRDSHGNLILDKNGKPQRRVPLAPYVDRMDTEKYDYFTYGGIINQKIEEKRQEEAAARRAYAMQGLNDFKNTMIGFASVYTSIPMLVLDSKYGAGLGFYGIRYLSKGAGRRKIEGAKKIEKDKKYTGKKLLFAFATAGMSQAAYNIKENSDDTNYVLHTKYPQELALLEESRRLEDKLGHILVNISKENLKDLENQQHFNEALDQALGQNLKVEEAKKKLRQVAQQIDYRRFEKAVNVTLEQVRRSEIEKVVNQYVLKNNIVNFTDRDINNIISNINQELKRTNKDVRVTAELGANIRAEINRRATAILEQNEKDINEEIRNKKAKDNIDSDEIDIDTSEKVDILGDLKDKRETITESERNKNRDKKDRVEFNIYKENSEKDDYGLNYNYKEYLEHIDRKDMVDLITESLEKKNSISREVENEKYKDAIEIVKKLNHINDEYLKVTGEPIYQFIDKNTAKPYENSAGELVKRMKAYIDDAMNV